MGLNFDLHANTVLLTVGGSRAYGINVPTSDVDLRGVVIPPSSHYFGVLDKFESIEGIEHFEQFLHLLTPEESSAAGNTKLEGSLFEMRKFIRMAMQANPNIFDCLFARDVDVRLATPVGQTLRRARHLFVTAQARGSYLGYIASQQSRLERHQRWLADPPTEPGLNGTSQQRSDWNDYGCWRKNQGSARAALDAAHGYDTKAAGHMVRLARMAWELLAHGEVNVWREDAEELRDIRLGSWSYDRVMQEVKEHVDAIDVIWQAKTFKVPAAPDRKAISDLCCLLIEEHLATA